MKKILTLIVMLSFSLAASAQEDVSKISQEDTLKEIQVIGYKKQPVQLQPVNMLSLDIELKYLPMTVSKIDNSTLERKHIVEMNDAVRFLPGVVRTSNQLGAFERYSIRGTTDAVFAYDGIRDERTLTNTVPFGDLTAVESIEVIKGPASILAGHSVMGGVINIVRKKPTDKFSANASISYGSWEEKDATMGFGGKLLGPVNYRAHIHYSNGDGYREVNSDRFSGMFAIGSKIGKKGYLDASINFADDHYTTDIGGAPVMPNDIYNTSNDQLYLPSGVRNPNCDYEKVFNDNSNNLMRRRNLDVMATYTQELTSWLKLRERFSFQHSNLDYAAVENVSYLTSNDPIYDHWYINKSNNKKVYVNLDTVKRGTPLVFNPDHKTWTNNIDFSGNFETGNIKHNFTIGWNYSFFDFTQYNGYNADDVWGPGLSETMPVSDPHSEGAWWDWKVSAAVIRNYTTNALYITDVIDFNEHWKAMVSGRFDSYKYKNSSAVIEDGKQHYDKENRKDWTKVSTSALTYRFGIVYLPVPEVSIYASAASYYKPNNTIYNKNYIYYDRNGNEFNPDQSGGEVFKPETGNQFEAGIRWEKSWFDINASAYYMRKHNVVTTIGNLTVEENGEEVSKSVRAQVGRSESIGFDFDVTVRPVQNLQVVAGLGWSDFRKIASEMDWAKGLDWITLNEDGTINLRATGVPRTTFFTYADYTIPKGFFKDLSFHLSGTYTDKIYSDIVNNVYDPARYIVDAGVYYTINNTVTVSFLLNNVFNEHYFASATRLAKPRNFRVTVAYKF